MVPFEKPRKTGVEQIINERHRLAKKLAEILQKDKDFIVLNEVEINAVCFMYVGNINPNNVELLNNVNKKIHSRIVEIGDYHLHTFSIPDAGVIKRGEKLCPLRYMSGNPIVKEKDLHNLVSHVKCIGQALTNHAKKTRITTSL